MLRPMNRLTEARDAYRAALRLATNRHEQEFLGRRIGGIEGV
jgi:predicted RNA polymerase sigma factor